MKNVKTKVLILVMAVLMVSVSVFSTNHFSADRVKSLAKESAQTNQTAVAKPILIVGTASILYKFWFSKTEE